MKGTREKWGGKVVGEVIPEHYKSSVPVDSQECCIMHISSSAPQGTESERKNHQYITVQTWHFCNWEHTREKFYWKHIFLLLSALKGPYSIFVCDWLEKGEEGRTLEFNRGMTFKIINHISAKLSDNTLWSHSWIYITLSDKMFPRFSSLLPKKTK